MVRSVIAARWGCLLLTTQALAACSGSEVPKTVPAAPTPSLSAAALLGEKIFHDPSLSASGKLACAHCHDAAHGMAAGDGLPVSLGGPDGLSQGTRNAPSLRYLKTTPTFYFDADATPTGGFDRDGRADSLSEQAARPFLSPVEMANADAAEVGRKLSEADYAAEFKALFGERIFDDPQSAFERALFAIARYETENLADFAPFTSKYDHFLAGATELDAAELRGLSLFNDPRMGNCAACHPSGRGANGEAPLFTDFTYDNLGVPRNAAIAANADSAFFDLGLCGPLREDLASRTELCGAFKVPTLRNVAITAPYFHNGRFDTLKKAVEFYVRRDTHPEEFYPLDESGRARKFDDLPAAYRGNVNITEAPYDRLPGDVPALNAAEIADLVSFLETLTDGYQP